MIGPLTTPQIPAAARVLARAMDVDPGYRYVAPEADREDALERLFTGMLSLHASRGCTWVWTEDGAVRACATVRPAGGLRIGAPEMLRHGLLPFAWARGLGAVRRLLWLKHTYDALEHELSAGRPSHLVHLVGVAPERQGAGVGGQLVGEALARACEVGVPAILTTHLPRNVVFYRRLGFEVAFERSVAPRDAPAWTVWGMRR